MALLASYMINGGGRSLADWLDAEVFAGMEKLTVSPEKNGKDGFGEYIGRYKSAVGAEKLLGEVR